jgi:predicted RNase H-like HicB family nuclease
MRVCIKIIRNEQGGYTAMCTSLPGCVSRGKTREEAKENLDKAIRGYVAAVGNFVPERVLHEVLEA